MEIRGDELPFLVNNEMQEVWPLLLRFIGNKEAKKSMVVWVGTFTFKIFGYPNTHFDRRTLLEVTKNGNLIPDIVYLSEADYEADKERQQLMMRFFEEIRFSSRLHFSVEQLK